MDLKKKKICVFIGSRGNYLILNSILRNIIKSDRLDLILIVGASAILDNYGNVDRKIIQDGFEINERLFMIIEGETLETMAESTGLGIIKLSRILHKYKPDLTLNIADRSEMLAFAIASTYNNIPIIHIQGGEVSGSSDESIRHAITKLSHIHFPANELSKQRLLQMGEDKRYIFNFGCPRIDTIKMLLGNPYPIEEINTYIKTRGVGDIFDINSNFIIFSQHSVTTEYNQSEQQITNTLKALKEISEEQNIHVIGLWPNVDAGSNKISRGIRIFRESKFEWQDSNKKYNKNFHFFKYLPFEYYIRLMDKTLCLIGNSSSGIREGAFIGTPVVNIGTRQNNRLRGKNVMDVNYDYKNIKEAIEKQIEHGKYESELIYGDGNTGKRIVEVLESIDVKIQKTFITMEV